MKIMIYIVFFAILSGQALAADMIKMTPLQQKNLSIKTVQLKTVTNIVGQAYPAEVVVPVNQIRMVSSAYAGLIDQLQVTAGQTVKKGQVLAHISSPELITMQREYLQSSAQKRLAQQSLDRDVALFKDGIIAEKRLQGTQNSHVEAAAQTNEHRQLLKFSGMSDGAINQLEKGGRYQSGMTLVAPISGVVLEQMATQGQRIDAVTPLLKIAQLNPLWVEIHVPLADIKSSNIKKGAVVNIKGLDATGSVIAMLPSMRSQDQTAIVRVEVKQGAENLFPSQMVDAMIVPNNTENSFTVPSSALVNSKSRVVVFVQASNGFEAREVKILNTQGETSAITGEFNGTEKVAITGTATIKGSWLGMGGLEDE
ncbi:AcrA Membrane-fusion protein [Methylophilaceae bacterium]